jgi:hypothetical protein
MNRLLNLLKPSENDIDKIIPYFDQLFFTSLFLKSRTERYDRVVLTPEGEETEPKTVFTRKEPKSIIPQLFSKLKVINKQKLNRRESSRKQKFTEELMQEAEMILSTHRSTPLTFETITEQLSQISQKFNQTEYKPSRKSILSLKYTSSTDLPFIQAAIKGDWTNQRPQSLIKKVVKVEKILRAIQIPEAEVKNLIQSIIEPVQTIREQNNRKGHNKSRPYPGAHKWTKEYHNCILKSCGRKKYLEQMKKFTEVYQFFKNCKGVGLSELDKVVERYPDANRLELVIAKVKHKFGVKVVLELLKKTVKLD